MEYGMRSDRRIEPYAEYIGINKAVNPGIRVLIDFLAYYFEPNTEEKTAKNFSWDRRKEKLRSIIICKENSEEVRESLYDSAFEWIRSYATFRQIDGRSSQEYLIPLTPGMLLKDANAAESMRNILNAVLYSVYDEADQRVLFEEVQEKLYRFLYSEQAQKGGYEELLRILSTLFDGDETDRKKKFDSDAFSGLKWKSEKLAEEFREDLMFILDNEYLMEENIYKRINELNIFLNFYIIRYMISRSFEEKKNFIVAKGSLNMPSEGKLHSAAVGNFANIREQIYKVSEQYYYQIFKIVNKEDGSLLLNIEKTNAGGGIRLWLGRDDIWPRVRSSIFRTGRGEKNSAEERRIEKFEEMLLDYFGVIEGEKGVVTTNQEMSYACMEINKKRSSSVRRVSAVFSSQGKECYFAYPIGNVQQKYYVMSPQLTEVLVRLFLCRQEAGYGTLEMLCRWLEERYSVYVGYSPELVRYLRENTIEQPTQVDFDENQKAFIKTLEEINCIVKLTDNSYTITFDGEKGKW